MADRRQRRPTRGRQPPPLADAPEPVTPDKIRQNRAPFRWNKAKSTAAQLVAEDELTGEEIAARLKIARCTLYAWKSHPEFAARAQGIAEQIGALVVRYGLAKLARRVCFMNERYLAMQAVITARAKEHKKAPGGATGLLVRKVRSIGSGPAAQLVEEYEVDVGLLREIRELEKQAAQQLEQWVEKHEVSGAGGKPLLPTLEEMVAALRAEDRRHGASGNGVAGTNGTGLS